jgi:plastocyanin
MRKLIFSLVLVLPFLVAACGGAAGGGGATAAPNTTPTITMNAMNFTGNTKLSIKAGQAVLFDDPAGSGGTHFLLTGTNGRLTLETGAPSVFESPTGILFNAGDQKSITFANAGTFLITCTIHPYMQATIAVTA